MFLIVLCISLNKGCHVFYHHMMRSDGRLIMVSARVNNLFTQQRFSLIVGPITIKVNGCCKTTFDLCGSYCGGGDGDEGGGGGGGDGGGGSE